MLWLMLIWGEIRDTKQGWTDKQQKDDEWAAEQHTQNCWEGLVEVSLYCHLPNGVLLGVDGTAGLGPEPLPLPLVERLGPA